MLSSDNKIQKFSNDLLKQENKDFSIRHQISVINNRNNKNIATKIQDVLPTLIRIGEQYIEQQNKIKEANKKLKEFEQNVYKDQQMQKMRTALMQMEDDYYRGFPITKEEKKNIYNWVINHENTYHGGYPCYHGVSGGGYSYQFHPTAIGTGGQIICNSCREKARRESSGKNLQQYEELLKKYDAIFYFQQIK